MTKTRYNFRIALLEELDEKLSKYEDEVTETLLNLDKPKGNYHRLKGNRQTVKHVRELLREVDNFKSKED